MANTKNKTNIQPAEGGQGDAAGQSAEQATQPVNPYAIEAVSDSGNVSYLTPEDYISDEWIGKIYTDPRRLSLSVKTMCFHNTDAKGNPTGVIDNRIYEYLIHTQHIFVVGKVPYIYSGGCYRPDFDGASIKTLIKHCCLEQFIRSTTTKRIYELFFQDDRIQKFPEELNAHPGHFINFQNGMYDVIAQKMYRHSPKILSVNQIPWDYSPNADHGAGTEIENFLRFSIPDDDDREMLLEYIGLCCSIDVHQQKMMVICGDGGTGKSTIINLIQEIVGKRNTSNVAMSKLEKDFHAIQMMGKLLNACADLEIDALDDTSTLKKLVGEDSIQDSYKGKDLISFDNYSKLLFSTNELPLVRNEKTEGFYRRLLILTMNEKPEHRDPTLLQRLRNEIPYLLHLAMEALHRMYERGNIFESENSKLRVKQLRADSDTIEAFLTERTKTTRDLSDRIKRNEIFEAYEEYCKDEGRQPHQKNGFYKALRNKGFKDSASNGVRYFYGLVLVDPDTDEEGFMKLPEDADLKTPFPE